MANNTAHIEEMLVAPGGLATLLRAARGRLTAKDLAGRAKWPIAKISKIEHGKQLPKPEDLDAWREHTGASLAELLHWRVLLDEADAARDDFAAQTRAGNRVLQQRFNEIIAGAKRIRIYEPAFIPRFLQTPEYARAVLEESHDRHGGARDVDAAVAERQLSLSALDDPDKQLEMVITEPVLGWRFAAISRDALRAQLEHLLAAIDARPNARIGIIPQFQPITWIPQDGFQLFDNLGFAETWLGERKYVLTQDISRLERVMDKMWSSAREGDQARAIIQAAIDRLDAADD